MDNSVKPIKKTFAFYKTSDNLWNSKYLASPKISRYFHEPNDAYLSGPNSPLSLSVKASVNLSDDYLKKATGQVREAKYRLHQQKLHREYVEII